jgi:NTP pyrophosphatase (non-canonical NTP hydrolase)
MMLALAIMSAIAAVFCGFIFGAMMGANCGDSMFCLQCRIGDWQQRAFGQNSGDPEAIKATRTKLVQEIGELDVALSVEDYFPGPQVCDEIADCGVLLLGLADKLRIDLHEQIERKMEINRARSWRQNDDGTFQHKS